MSFSYLIFLVCLGVIFFLLTFKPGKHRRNIRKGKQIIQKINTFDHPGQKINYLKKIDPFVFEELLLSAFKNKGFKIVRNKRYTGDGGIDGVLYDQQNNKIVLQAKRYSNYINRQHLKDFERIIALKKATKGYFVHTGKSSPDTRKLFFSSKIEIIGGSKLLELLATH
ncbi:restriction endonuclease [Aquimarina mytili]|uniref:Restriction endonuclease n=1 Tax=Aquimarina mytili TaxID=874423 RepID=A0A937A8A3_9FLAO|nr:restriction endonuclease [Aquimarina mytili]MBL0686059.1 restriction endonuclease [Aquimarina mytili]